MRMIFASVMLNVYCLDRLGDAIERKLCTDLPAFFAAEQIACGVNLSFGGHPI